MTLVERRRLLTALQRCPAPLVTIAAPAGAGKSTVLLQWAAVDERPVAWLQLDRYDNDPATFLAYLTAAFEREVGVGEAVSRVVDPPTPRAVRTALLELADRLASSDPFVFVLDDAHTIDNRRCWHMVETLLESLRPGSQLAVGTRESPPLPLARLRASAEVAEFGMAELALDEDEAAQLLENHGLHVDAATVTKIVAATEGWATGLSLTALACRDRTPTDWDLQVRGDQRDIARYLVGEILDRQSERTRSFLLITSILDRLSPANCREISGRADAADELERIADANLFLVRLDDRRRRYRYHHLFAECLQAELLRSAPELATAAHRKAAAWYRGRGKVEKSIHHSLAAGDAVAAGDLLASNWVPLVARGRFDTATRLLASFSEEQIAAQPALAIAAGWLTVTGPATRTSAARLRNACTIAAEGPSVDGAASLRSSQLILRALAAPDGIHRMGEDARAAVVLERDSSPGWRANATLAHGAASWFAGDSRRAVSQLRTTIRDGDRVNVPATLTAHNLLALVFHEQGDHTRAAEHAAAGRAVAAAVEPEADFTFALTHAVAALAPPDGSQDGVAASLALAGEQWQNTGNLPWLTILTALVIAEVDAERGDFAAARRWCDAARRSLDIYPDAGTLHARALRIETLLLDEAVESITPAERRVLCLLPTHLSTQAIADRLFLSRNTVKTEMSSLYRKLGAGTRSEAVDRAIGLGLIDPEAPPQARASLP